MVSTLIQLTMNNPLQPTQYTTYYTKGCGSTNSCMIQANALCSSPSLEPLLPRALPSSYLDTRSITMRSRLAVCTPFHPITVCLFTPLIPSWVVFLCFCVFAYIYLIFLSLIHFHIPYILPYISNNISLYNRHRRSILSLCE